MSKPDAVLMGRIEVFMDEDDPQHEIPMGLLIKFDDPEQIRQALKDGRVEFTVMGREP
jgi:hypothetical protein